MFVFLNIYTSCLYFYYKNSSCYNQRISHINKVCLLLFLLSCDLLACLYFTVDLKQDDIQALKIENWMWSTVKFRQCQTEDGDEDWGWSCLTSGRNMTASYKTVKTMKNQRFNLVKSVIQSNGNSHSTKTTCSFDTGPCWPNSFVISSTSHCQCCHMVLDYRCVYDLHILDLTPSQHGSEDYATSPDICRLSSVLCLAQKLRSHVGKSPTQSIQKALSAFKAKHGCQAKICQLQVIWRWKKRKEKKKKSQPQRAVVIRNKRES